MTVSELKELLDKAIAEGYGNAPVEIYPRDADGGTRVKDVLYDKISLILYDWK